VEATTVDGLAGLFASQCADSGNPAARDPDVTHALAIVVDDGCAFEDQIVGLGH
jgi:hypothetical protein